MQKAARKFNGRTSRQAGFTLIELLIVIVILGILGGVVIAVINPAQQQDRARQAVMRSNLEKIMTAVIACANSTTDPYNNCDTFAEIGVEDPSETPLGMGYRVFHWTNASGRQGLYMDACYDGTTSYNSCSVCAMRYAYYPQIGDKPTTHTKNGCLVDFE